MILCVQMLLLRVVYILFFVVDIFFVVVLVHTHTNTSKNCHSFFCDSFFCINDILLLTLELSSSSSSSSQKQQREKQAATTTNNDHHHHHHQTQKSQKSDFGHFFTKHSDFNDDVHYTSIKRRRGRTRSKCIS